MNIAFVGDDGVLRHPKFEHILSGCTSLRLLELAPARGRAAARRAGVHIPVDEGRGAREMPLIGSSVKVAPIVVGS
jgi:4-amino-4-deoxychorismate lyase